MALACGEIPVELAGFVPMSVGVRGRGFDGFGDDRVDIEDSGVVCRPRVFSRRDEDQV
jgi:hypothetical protein